MAGMSGIMGRSWIVGRRRMAGGSWMTGKSWMVGGSLIIAEGDIVSCTAGYQASRSASIGLRNRESSLSHSSFLIEVVGADMAFPQPKFAF